MIYFSEMLASSLSYSRKMLRFKVALMFMMQTMMMASSSQINEVQNMTKLLSHFVLTCGSSAGFCNQSLSPLRIEPSIIPECAQWLKCDPTCALAYKCAPDATFAYIDVSCISSSIYPLKVGFSSNWYTMITQCGIFSTNTERKTDDCTGLPERTINNLHDDIFRPVITRGSQITYRNVQCARCNGEEDADIVPFELKVECYEKFDINSFNTLQDAWNAIYENNCSVAYVPSYEFFIFR